MNLDYVERWIFPGDFLLEDRKVELDQRKRPLNCSRNVAFDAFLRPSSGNSCGSTIPDTSFRAPQTTAAYKYLVNSPEMELEKTESKAPPLLQLLL